MSYTINLIVWTGIWMKKQKQKTNQHFIAHDHSDCGMDAERWRISLQKTLSTVNVREVFRSIGKPIIHKNKNTHENTVGLQGSVISILVFPKIKTIIQQRHVMCIIYIVHMFDTKKLC